MTRLFVVAMMILAALGLLATPSVVAQGGKGTPTTTTLDACGYFVGTETASNSRETVNADGSTTVTERGTWIGVSNNYGNGPVASLGTVKGSYHKVVTENADGSLSGTESFNSGAGKIEQTFSFTPGVGYTVSVSATRDLSFLTSDTAGSCYAGEFPRP